MCFDFELRRVLRVVRQKSKYSCYGMFIGAKRFCIEGR